MRKASVGKRNAAKDIVRDKSIQIRVTDEERSNYHALAKFKGTILTDMILNYLEQEYQKEKANIHKANTQAR